MTGIVTKIKPCTPIPNRNFSEKKSNITVLEIGRDPVQYRMQIRTSRPLTSETRRHLLKRIAYELILVICQLPAPTLHGSAPEYLRAAVSRRKRARIAFAGYSECSRDRH
jgi:hypothetical protein